MKSFAPLNGSKKEGFIQVTVETRNGTTNSAWYYQCTYTYLISPEGDIFFDLKGTPDMLPRLGVTMHLDKSLANVKYFGKGPRENYVDSQEAGLFGVYDATVSEMFTNYIVPQANGNRMDTRWSAFTDDRGQGIVAAASDTYNFSVSYFDERTIDEAKHTYELQESDYVVLNIDYKQNALGSYSCGQWQLKKYRTTFEEFQLSFRLLPFNNKEISANALANEQVNRPKFI